MAGRLPLHSHLATRRRRGETTQSPAQCRSREGPPTFGRCARKRCSRFRAGQPEAVLRFQANGDLRGEWDADRLAQVVSNLVGNAIQHGGGTLVTLISQVQGDSVTLAVHNGGPPIPAELLPFVFEPLARGRAEGPSDSIGLGLFIFRRSMHVDLKRGSLLVMDSATQIHYTPRRSQDERGRRRAYQSRVSREAGPAAAESSADSGLYRWPRSRGTMSG